MAKKQLRTVPSKRNVKKTVIKKRPKSLMRETASNALEKKTVDVSAAMGMLAASVAWSALTQINVIPQGTTGNQRVGRKVQMKSLYLRANWNQCIRMLVVYDRASQNGSAVAPLITDILTADTNLAHKNLNNGERFVTLIDETTIYEGATAVAAQYSESYRKIDLSAIYTATTGAAAELATGGVWIMFSNPATATPVGNYYSRIRYTDI